MSKPEEHIDDHHCSVIERARIKEDLEACDSGSNNETDRRRCRTEASEFSKKREQACKYS
jgi:hypothetical protein